MFTGLIADLGEIVALERTGDGVRLTVASALAAELDEGDSIAVNGVCLTATELEGEKLSVDVMGETLRRTTIGALKTGDKVNLERCTPAGGRPV